MDPIFSFKDSNETFKDMVLRISYKWVEEFISSKVVMMEGALEREYDQNGRHR